MRPTPGKGDVRGPLGMKAQSAKGAPHGAGVVEPSGQCLKHSDLSTCEDVKYNVKNTKYSGGEKNADLLEYVLI